MSLKAKISSHFLKIPTRIFDSLFESLAMYTSIENASYDFMKGGAGLIDFTAEIQQGIIPHTFSSWNGIQFAGYYSPMGKVSEDYYVELDTNGMFLGSIREASEFYENKETRLTSGDRFYLYTDGIVEHKNPEGEEWGMDQFVDALGRTKKMPLAKQIETITQELYEFIGTASIKDDISILAFELETVWGKFTEIYNSALRLVKSGNLQIALEKLSEAYELIPTYTNVHFQLALVQYHLRNLQEAEKHIQEFLKNKPVDIQGLKLAINIHAKMGNIKEKNYLMNVLKDLENQ
jgi:hypothetical protein